MTDTEKLEEVKHFIKAYYKSSSNSYWDELQKPSGCSNPCCLETRALVLQKIIFKFGWSYEDYKK